MNDIEEVVDRGPLRSRFALYHGVYLQKQRARRSRELSRIPLKALKKILKKRSGRKVVIRNILKTHHSHLSCMNLWKHRCFEKD